MIKILLTSDIHLGMGTDEVPIPESVRMATFRKICALASEHHLLLIAGDLFHGDAISKETIEGVSREFGILREKGVEIVYTPGDHELSENGTPQSYLYHTGASHIFTGNEDTEIYSFKRGSEHISIYGFPATNNDDIVRIRKQSRDGFHIGLFHADFSLEEECENARVFILQKSDIKSLSLDFYALGHHHFFKLFKFQNRIIGAYPGSPEAVSFSESGERYVLSISIENNEIFQIKRLSVNSVKVSDMTVDCSETRSCSELTELLRKNRSSKTLLRLTLTGQRRYHIDGNPFIDFEHEYFRLILVDKSAPSMDLLIEEFGRENTLRGEFFTFLRERMAQHSIPPDINLSDVARILNGISRKGYYAPEEWLCE